MRLSDEGRGASTTASSVCGRLCEYVADYRVAPADHILTCHGDCHAGSAAFVSRACSQVLVPHRHMYIAVTFCSD